MLWRYRFPLSLLLSLSSPFMVQAQSNSWSPTGNMTLPRFDFTLTRLANGEALAVGGCTDFFCNQSTGSAERYNPTTATWQGTGSLPNTRSAHTATLLSDGQVLVTGGCRTATPCEPALKESSRYDPNNGAWSTTGNLITARYDHQAALLATGEVLVVGGISTCGSRICTPLATAEIYSPTTGTWRAAQSLPSARVNHTLTTLTDGRVLLTGGCSGTGLPCTSQGGTVYDPVLNTWTPTGPMQINRSLARATLLDSGKVLVSGGLDTNGFQTSAAEVYDPATNTWSPAAPMPDVHYDHLSALLPSGQVLVAGGSTASSQTYNPVTGLWVSVGNLSSTRSNPGVVVLANGSVLTAGGRDSSSNPLASAELFTAGQSPSVLITPQALSFDLQAAGTTSDPQTLMIKNNGTAPLNITGISIVGGGAPVFSSSTTCLVSPVPAGGQCTAQVEFSPVGYGAKAATLNVTNNSPDSPQTVAIDGFGYKTGPNSWGPGATMNQARSSHTATLLPDGDLLIAGGSGLRSAEVYDVAAQTWTPTGSMAQVHAGHTATLLTNGTVLVVGGGPKEAERYDLTTGTWSSGGMLSINRVGHTATLLTNGTVLVVGGGTPERYDPQTNSWSLVAPLATERTKHTASRLPDGRVLIAGGINTQGTTLKSTEIYDPVTNQWQAGPNLSFVRYDHTATTLTNGKILVAGGIDFQVLRSTEIYNPLTGLWTSGGLMPVGHAGHTATRLANGSVLITGGINGCEFEFGFCFESPVAERFSPATATWTKASKPIQARSGQTATLLPNQKVLVTGGTNFDALSSFSTTEIYTP